MRRKKSHPEQTAGTPVNHIPDIDIIDLELDGNDMDDRLPELIEGDLLRIEALQKQLGEDLLNTGIIQEQKESPVNEVNPLHTGDLQEQEKGTALSRKQNKSNAQNTDDLEQQDKAISETNDDGLQEENAAPKKGLRSFLNMHVLLLLVFVIFVVSIVVRFMNWGQRINQSDIIKNESGEYADVLDQILPLTDADGKPIIQEKMDTIVAFGNSPFSDDRDSRDNLANMIADAAGAKVYNCSVSGSYLASERPAYDSKEAPMDAYCFYWLITLATSGANSHYYEEAKNILGDALPPEAQEVYDTLTTLDFNTVDVVTVMYDATDYLMGHEMYDDANSTNIQQFTGNLEAGIELLQATYPNIRIIVMSPTYAFAVDENGEYVSSDIYTFGQDVLSTYSIKEFQSATSRGVSFIDHLYGTITEANAKDYLTDNLHLNVEGRKLVRDRFLKALNYYNQDNKEK